MARVTGQSVPPSLANLLAQQVVIAKPVSGPGRIARINHWIYRATPEPQEEDLGRFSAYSADWLRDNWRRTMPSEALSAFYRDRKAEIFAGEFPSKYWRELVPTEDVTEYGTPKWVLPSTRPMAPEYADSLRQPSNCPIDTYSAVYPTPTGAGTTEQPAPGWKGIVEDSLFRDLYMAQRRLTFALHYATNAEGKRPIVLRIDATISAQASTRGNAAWFIVHSKGHFWTATSPPPEPENAMHSNWLKSHRMPTGLPGANPGGWSHVQKLLAVRNARLRTNLKDQGTANRLWIRIATPPSRGIYYARNDWVEVSHTANVRIYQARAWND